MLFPNSTELKDSGKELKKGAGNSFKYIGLKTWHSQLAWLARVDRKMCPDGSLHAILCYPVCPNLLGLGPPCK